MRIIRKQICVIIICLSILLSGCSNPVAQYREIEHLLVIQTMGLDRENGHILLSLASAADSGGESARTLSAEGSTVSTAMEHIYDYSFEEELFCYHVRQVLIGERAAENGIGDYLGYICRSPVMRIDVPIYVVKGAAAKELITYSGDGSRGISEIMRNMEAKLEQRGGTFSSADVLRNLKRCGSALICAVEYSEADESTEDDSPGMTAAAAGYAIIRGGMLCRYIEAEDAAAAELLMNRPGLFTVEVSDGHGGRAVLEINSGGADFSPVWSGDAVTGMNIRLSAEYSVLETDGKSSLQDEHYTDALTAALESYLLEHAEKVLQSSASLKADFLGLALYAERSDPSAFRRLGKGFPELLPAMEFHVSVGCRIRHTNDMKDI